MLLYWGVRRPGLNEHWRWKRPKEVKRQGGADVCDALLVRVKEGRLGWKGLGARAGLAGPASTVPDVSFGHLIAHA
eukprot:892592-Rhodomonas_salina.3